MLTEKMQKAMNDQINAELYSAYLYLGFSARLDEMGLKGCAHWMRIQYDEEMMHAMKLFDHVLERDGEVTLAAIAKPEIAFDSAQVVFQQTLEHERKVTGLINALMDVAISENDHASQSFLEWYVNEQVEEEANATEILDQLKLVGDHPNGLFMIDRELAQRPAATPIAAEEPAA